MEGGDVEFSGPVHMYKQEPGLEYSSEKLRRSWTEGQSI